MIYVIDASALINLKNVPASQQWEFFAGPLTAMVGGGSLVFPPQVDREVGRVPHPDLPGAWALGVGGSSPLQRDPDLARVREVLRECPGLIDPQGETEEADPYVLALALELRDLRQEVCVVTDDARLRLPPRISLAQACVHFKVPWIGWRGFHQAVATTQPPTASSHQPRLF